MQPYRDGELHTMTEASEKQGSSRVRDLLAPKVRPLMVIGLGPALLQQFVGINTVIYYAPTILADTGLTHSSSITQTVFVGITNVVFTIAAVLLLDRVGRRKLLLTGTVGMAFEIYPVGIRSKAMSAPTLGNWAANFLVAATFLSLGNLITRQGTFFLYAAIAVGAFVFFLAKVPETKDRTLNRSRTT